MAEEFSTPGFVSLRAGWTIPLPVCTIENNQDGSFSAWGRDWAVDVHIIELPGNSEGRALSASEILGEIDSAIRISGDGWIGTREVLHEIDNGSPVMRLATKLCAQNTFMSLWVSYRNEGFAPKAEAIVKYAVHKIPKAPTKPSGDQRITPLTTEDQLSLSQQRQLFGKYLRSEQEQQRYQTVEGKIALLRHLLTKQVFKASQTYEYGCMGVVLGDALAQKLKMEWVAVEDSDGRDLAIRLPKTSIIIFPIGMIFKRVSRGENFDIVELFTSLFHGVVDLRKKGV